MIIKFPVRSLGAEKSPQGLLPSFRPCGSNLITDVFMTPDEYADKVSSNIILAPDKHTADQYQAAKQYRAERFAVYQERLRNVFS